MHVFEEAWMITSYRDFSRETNDRHLETVLKDSKELEQQRFDGVGSNSTMCFPKKLHQMVTESSEIDSGRLADIISWQSQGRSFIIHNTEKFVIEILPLYFPRISTLPAFKRQLTCYGFQRIKKGKNKGGYYHENFQRGMSSLCHRIQRIETRNPVVSRPAKKGSTITGTTNSATGFRGKLLVGETAVSNIYEHRKQGLSQTSTNKSDVNSNSAVSSKIMESDESNINEHRKQGSSQTSTSKSDVNSKCAVSGKIMESGVSKPSTLARKFVAQPSALTKRLSEQIRRNNATTKIECKPTSTFGSSSSPPPPATRTIEKKVTKAHASLRTNNMSHVLSPTNDDSVGLQINHLNQIEQFFQFSHGQETAKNNNAVTGEVSAIQSSFQDETETTNLSDRAACISPETTVDSSADDDSVVVLDGMSMPCSGSVETCIEDTDSAANEIEAIMDCLVVPGREPSELLKPLDEDYCFGEPGWSEVLEQMVF